VVAGLLALVDQSSAQPPDERVEPEHGLHDHVERRRQVVASPDVRKLVGKDRFDVRVV
jgi:hypothetical protein